MADTAIDLWPEDLGVEEVTAPVTILKTQATLLGDRFHNIIEAQVVTTKYDEMSYPSRGDRTADNVGIKVMIRHAFELVAPALGGYRYLLFVVDHDISLYPLVVQSTPGTNGQKCQNEAEFYETLRVIFASEETRKVIASLLAQSKA